MKKFDWQKLMKWLNARHVRERTILLVAGLGIVGMVWLTFVHDVMVAAMATEARNITVANALILEEQNRQEEIRRTYTTDPNTYALSRQRELRDAANDAKSRLDELYGELVTPQQMSQVLTTILQSETQLTLVGLENQPVEPLIPETEVTEENNAIVVQVFKHGLHMVFEGSFLETVYYLRRLERLDGNFFWDNLQFELLEYPNARINLDIYTLSTEQGYIGV